MCGAISCMFVRSCGQVPLPHIVYRSSSRPTLLTYLHTYLCFNLISRPLLQSGGRVGGSMWGRRGPQVYIHAACTHRPKPIHKHTQTHMYVCSHVHVFICICILMIYRTSLPPRMMQKRKAGWKWQKMSLRERATSTERFWVREHIF